jgi:hypothetical protein
MLVRRVEIVDADADGDAKPARACLRQTFALAVCERHPIQGIDEGWMDVRHVEHDGAAAIEFSWEGNDECDAATGRGSSVLRSDWRHTEAHRRSGNLPTNAA